jgi:hypothetical protein
MLGKLKGKEDDDELYDDFDMDVETEGLSVMNAGRRKNGEFCRISSAKLFKYFH